MKKILGLLLIMFLWSCGATKKATNSNNKIQTQLRDSQSFLLTEISTDKSYGYSEKNPIEVGGVDKEQGPLNERRFLNAIAGPNGEKVTYYRVESCCPIESDSNPLGFGKVFLDKYRVTWEGAKDTFLIYINMYDYGELKVPFGFTIKDK